MSLDDKIQGAKDRDLPWDDLRERRVLAEFRKKRDAGVVAEPVAPRRRTSVLLAAGMMTTAAAVVLAILGTGQLGAQPSTSEAVIGLAATASASTHNAPTAAESAATEADAPARPRFASRMQLSDGSVVELAAGAEVTVREQSEALIGLQQTDGRAHYEVLPALPRRFEVVAAGVVVEVVGTSFDIDVSPSQVAVAVERGKVKVTAGDRVAELGTGDNLRITRPLVADADADADTDADEATPAARLVDSAARAERARVPSASQLLDRVDAARARGDQPEAAQLLRKLLKAHPTDPRAASAWFTLGRVEKSRGRLRDAAKAFAHAHDQAPAGPLAEDALAESAKAWARAGADAPARRAASRYLDRFAQGTHRARMAKIAAE